MILLALMLIVEIPHAQKCSVYHIWVPVLLYLSIYRSIYLYVCPSNYLPISLCMCIYIWYRYRETTTTTTTTTTEKHVLINVLFVEFWWSLSSIYLLEVISSKVDVQLGHLPTPVGRWPPQAQCRPGQEKYHWLKTRTSWVQKKVGVHLSG